MEKTTIAINKSTREALRLLGKKDEDYDAIIKKCINFTKKFENESVIQISDDLRQKLKLLAAYRNTTYEDLFCELIGNELCKLKLDSGAKANANKNKK